MKWFKKLWGKAKEIDPKVVLQKAKDTLGDASESLAVILEDRDQNGLPDRAELIARHATQVVLALETIIPESGQGARKFQIARDEFLSASGQGTALWAVVAPWIEAAVKLMNVSK